MVKIDPDMESVTLSKFPCEPNTCAIAKVEPDPIAVSWLLPELDISALDAVTSCVTVRDPVTVEFPWEKYPFFITNSFAIL